MKMKHDPTKTKTKVSGAIAELRRRMREAKAAVVDYVDKLPKAVTVNYSFELDYDEVMRASSDIERIIAEYLLDDEWLFTGYVGPAYQQGQKQAAATLAPQLALFSEVPAATLATALTPIYQRRYNLVRARVFEEMKGFAGQVADDLGSLLARSVLEGDNPLDVGKAIADRFGVELYRGERIARTEITTALKRARMDEAEATEESTGLKVMLMHISAFSPTSRYEHMARHGNLYTADQIREWYSVDGNAINCQCSMIEVIVDDDGNPLAPGLLKRADAIKSKYSKRIEDAK